MKTDKIVLPEIVSIGIYNASIAHKNKATTPSRKTTMFEIELPIGDGGTSYINKTEHKISENVLIIAKPGQLRHTRLPFACYYIHAIINEGILFDTLSSLREYTALTDEQAVKIKKIFISLCEHNASGAPQKEIILGSLLLKLIHTVSSIASHLEGIPSPKQNNRIVVERTVAYIKNNLTADLSLNALAKEAKFSPIYFHKLFKASTGRTLRDYTEEQRINKAIELLTSTSLSLTEIAYESGFSSQYYFNYAFKKRMRITHREYAKSILSKYEY